MVLWIPTRPSRTNTHTHTHTHTHLVHYRGLECKCRKSRDTWSNRQIWPWRTKWNRANINRVLPREWSGHSKHTLPTSWEKTLHVDITRGSILKSDWSHYLQPKVEKLYIVRKKKKRPWADCNSDHELLIAKYRLKLKKVGKTTRPLRYDPHQIPYDYTVKVTDSKD